MSIDHAVDQKVFLDQWYQFNIIDTNHQFINSEMKARYPPPSELKELGQTASSLK
jgi:hypothetical protein